MTDFIARLKQRKLVQWAVAYVAFAFALIQGADVVAQQFGWLEGVRRGITLALVLGFFVVLVLAWYHGERGAQRVTGTELLIITLLLAVGGGVLWRYARAPVGSAAATNRGVAAANSTAPVSPALTTSAAMTPSSAATQSIPAKSIAVLPFENLSSDKDNAYFADGMQDEILTRLASIHDLKLISRTSTEQYASHPPNLKVVAEQLGVATLLEGSVQKADGKVRINLQLIDAHSDSHLWAQNYDRDLKDVFAVQSDVAEKVADALKAQLLPAESARIATVPTQNQEAYDRFLRAEYLVNRYNSGAGKDWADTVPKAEALYKSAIAADPDFALAYARFSYLKASTWWFGIDSSPQSVVDAQADAKRALELQPDLPEAHLAQGYISYWGHRDYAAALAEFAIARAPSQRRKRASGDCGRSSPTGPGVTGDLRVGKRRDARSAQRCHSYRFRLRAAATASLRRRRSCLRSSAGFGS